jgi:hypothetical protein
MFHTIAVILLVLWALGLVTSTTLGELPDVKKEDVKVMAEEGTLTIMGERKFEKEEKSRKYHRVERTYNDLRTAGYAI